MNTAPSSTPSPPSSSHPSITTVLSILLLFSAILDTVTCFSHHSLLPTTPTTTPLTIPPTNHYQNHRHTLPSSSSPSFFPKTPTFGSLHMSPNTPNGEDSDSAAFAGRSYSRSSSGEDGGEDDDVKMEPVPEVKCPDCDQCDGSGRILGGIATVIPWFIKAYRPCPVFIERGGNYVRSGQPLDEIAFGRMADVEDVDEYNS